MWSAQADDLEPGRKRRLSLWDGAQPVTFAAVAHGWGHDADFRAFFGAELARVPFAAFLWETPPVTRASFGRPFECVLVASPTLAAARPDAEAFRGHFAAARGTVTTFENLGGDALLVAPCPVGEPGAYVHLAAFLRSAPQAQQHALWRAVGDALAGRLGDAPLWLSACGLGVSWLHVRLDSWPKYYTHAPYRQRPG